ASYCCCGGDGGSLPSGVSFFQSLYAASRRSGGAGGVYGVFFHGTRRRRGEYDSSPAAPLSCFRVSLRYAHASGVCSCSLLSVCSSSMIAAASAALYFLPSTRSPPPPLASYRRASWLSLRPIQWRSVLMASSRMRGGLSASPMMLTRSPTASSAP